MTEEMKKAVEEELNIIRSLLEEWSRKYGVKHVDVCAILKQEEVYSSAYSTDAGIDICKFS